LSRDPNNEKNEPIFEVSLVPLLTGAKRTQEIEIDLEQGQRNILAKRFELLSIDDFSFRAELGIGDLPQSLQLKGRILAKVIQHCVLSLDRITASIEKEIDLLLVPNDAGFLGGLDGPEFEYYSGQTCDIGEIMAVELALAIDPYPRKVGGNLGEVGHNLTGINLTNEEEYLANKAPNMKNPFALLDKLKKH